MVALERVRASVAVAADGAGSVLRASAGIDADVEDYEQVAIVVNAATERPNSGEAFERFTPSGPAGGAAHGRAAATPWCGPCARNAPPSCWRSTTRRSRPSCWPPLAGAPAAGRESVSGNTYPLALSRAAETVAGRVVLIGNAAQALHPVAGQGFNLGLRDAATLAEMLAAPPPTPDFAELLARFSAWRAEDRQGVTRFTDGLVKLFGSELPGLGLVRNFGLLLFDLSPTAKRALSRVSWGFAGRMPRLARGLPLE